LHTSDHTTTIATSALLNSAVFTTFTVALSANTLSVHCYFSLLAIIDVFKSDLKRMFERFHLFWTGITLTATTSAHKHVEDVIHATTTGTTFFKTLLTILIINFTLLFITEDFMSILNLLKLFFITTTVGMVFECSLSESFLDLVS